jgi:hypothetical protein
MLRYLAGAILPNATLVRSMPRSQARNGKAESTDSPFIVVPAKTRRMVTASFLGRSEALSKRKRLPVYWHAKRMRTAQTMRLMASSIA